MIDELRPGPRDHLMTKALREALASADAELIDEVRLDPAEGPARLARHLAVELERILRGDGEAADQAVRVNDLLAALGDGVSGQALDLPPAVLRGIRGVSPVGVPEALPAEPATPFSQSDLLVNAEGQPNIGSELRAELASASRVDLICAFVIWSGVRHVREALQGVLDRGGEVRVITTTYMGATEKDAVDQLVRMGAQVKVALDARTTKLHAKAWLLERDHGLSTAFVGSSNLSHTALFDGLEWNVRLSSVDAPHVLERVRMTFEAHWASEHFESYDPEVNGKALADALAQHDRRSLGEATTISFAGVDVHPYPHQQRMLEALAVERERHDRHRNLVVAATGTGKTVVAALDYRELCRKHGGRPSLLFVAHRAEILDQSLATYQAVLRDGSFGSRQHSGHRATGEHVFATIQSLDIGRLDPDAFDVVVVDEFHHAAAPTYDRLLNHLRPKELLGLTATPERLDGRDVTEWFDDRIAVELRLWEAIDQGFLVPFQYFGVSDGMDLRDLTWRRGGYVLDELSNLLSNDNRRVGKLLEAIKKIVIDPGRMRALGFCVSKEHARFMAAKFEEAGLKSVALTGDDSVDERRARLNDLQAGRLQCIFSVEVLGEGVDVPDVDHLLLLRPTASATVFTQQLGRGLRRAEGKSHLTVIDLIGQQHREFRFEDRLRAIVDRRRGPIGDQVERDFPFLPAGCTIDLDRQSREVIVENLKATVQRSRWNIMAADLRRLPGDVRLTEFLDEFGYRVQDVYRKSGGSWTVLRRAADKPTASTADSAREAAALKALRGTSHIDDPERVRFYTHVAQSPRPPRLADSDERHRRLLTMFAWRLGSGATSAPTVDAFFAGVWREGAVRSEIEELLEALDKRSRTRPMPSPLDPAIPLTLHARYQRDEIVGALGYAAGVKAPSTREGILWVEPSQADVFFVDLHKAERDYSPTTMYRDYAINRELFHWESQSRQAPHQPVVQRYIHHRERGTEVLLFVRERKRDELGTAAFTFLGPATYVDHKGERPVSFTWRLPTPMPEELFESARSVAAA